MLESNRHTFRILDANYEKVDPRKFAQERNYLTEEEHVMFRNIWTKYEFLFNRNLGTWKTKTIYIELQPEAKLYHTKPYPVPRAHEALFKKEAERLFQLGVI